VRVMVAREIRKTLAAIGFAGIATLSFAQNHNGAKGEVPAAPNGVRAGFTLGSNGADSAAIHQTKAVLDVRDISGVDCTGVADSSAALNALTGNAPVSNNAITGRTLSFGGCASIKLSNTWLIKNQAGFIIDGGTRSGAAGKGVAITWSGSASGVMIDMEYVDGFQVQGFNLQGNATAGVGIQIDKNGAGGIWNTTDGRLVNNTYQGANPNWIGVSISPVSIVNVEDMRVEDSVFYCNATRATTAAIGIKVGGSVNAKNEIFKHNNFTSCFYGVYQGTGSMQVRDSEFENNGGTCGSGNGADIRVDGNTDVDIIDGNLDEDGTQGININNDSGSGGPNHPIVITNNHSAPYGCQNTNHYWYNLWGGPGYILEGDSWDADSNLVKVIGSTHGNPGTPIYTRGLFYPNSTFNSWWTHNQPAIADDLNIMNDKLMVYGVGSSINTPYPSPLLDFRAYVATGNFDDLVIQNQATPSGGTFLIKHQQGVAGTEMFGWDGSYPGINIAQIPTPAVLSVSQGGTTGSTNYSYAVVAYGPAGNTAGSPTSNTATGNATLSRTNYNLIQWYPVAGATKYCIWRMASSGTPSSTGNIGCMSALQVYAYSKTVSLGYASNIGCCTDSFRFRDTGLAGDSSALPSSNTTGTLSLPGQITSTLASGTAPLSITSSTPVSHLTLNAHPQVYEAGVLTTSEKIYTNTQALTGGAATHTFTNSFRFTSSHTFGCACTDQTAANACRAVPASATAVTLTGTGSDVLWLQCTGH